MTTRESQHRSPTSPGILNLTPQKPTGNPEKAPTNELYNPHHSRTNGHRNTKRRLSPSKYSCHKNLSYAAHSTTDGFLESPQMAPLRDSQDGYHRPSTRWTKMARRQNIGTQSATAPNAHHSVSPAT